MPSPGHTSAVFTELNVPNCCARTKLHTYPVPVSWLGTPRALPASRFSTPHLRRTSLESGAHQGRDRVPFFTKSGCNIFGQSLTLWKPGRQCDEMGSPPAFSLGLQLAQLLPKLLRPQAVEKRHLFLPLPPRKAKNCLKRCWAQLPAELPFKHITSF